MAKFKNRFEYIGASDFPVIMEQSKWKKRINLVLEKAQIIPMEVVNNSAVTRGSRLEQRVIREYENNAGVLICNFQKELTREKTNNCIKLVAHLDGEIENTNIPLEAKTTNIKNKWNEIPTYYIPQLEFQMFMNKSDKAVIAVGYVNSDDDEDICGFDSFEYKRQMTDEQILEYCIEFTKDIEKYQKEYGIVNNGKVIKSDFDEKLIEELETLNQKISEIKSQAKIYEDRKKIIENQIKNIIGINAGFETDLFKVSLGQRITSPTFDYKVSRSGLKIEYKRG